MATSEQIAALRDKLGEALAADQTQDDSLFTDAKLTEWIDGTSSLSHAAIEGWEAKLAHWSNLVNVTDGAASRNLSDLMDHAKYMISYYTKQTRGAGFGRSRVGSIVRPL